MLARTPLRLALGPVAALALAGCASSYKPDLEGKPAATVRIASVHPAESQVAVLESGCVPFEREDWEKRTRRIAVLKDAKSVYQKVPVGAPLALAFFTSTTTVQKDIATDAVCAVAIRFTPEAGAEYEAVFSGDSENCRMDLGKLLPQTGQGARTEPVKDSSELPGC